MAVGGVIEWTGETSVAHINHIKELARQTKAKKLIIQEYCQKGAVAALTQNDDLQHVEELYIAFGFDTQADEIEQFVEQLKGKSLLHLHVAGALLDDELQVLVYGLELTTATHLYLDFQNNYIQESLSKIEVPLKIKVYFEKPPYEPKETILLPLKREEYPSELNEPIIPLARKSSFIPATVSFLASSLWSIITTPSTDSLSLAYVNEILNQCGTQYKRVNKEKDSCFYCNIFLIMAGSILTEGGSARFRALLLDNKINIDGAFLTLFLKQLEAAEPSTKLTVASYVILFLKQKGISLIPEHQTDILRSLCKLMKNESLTDSGCFIVEQMAPFDPSIKCKYFIKEEAEFRFVLKLCEYHLIGALVYQVNSDNDPVKIRNFERFIRGLKRVNEIEIVGELHVDQWNTFFKNAPRTIHLLVIDTPLYAINLTLLLSQYKNSFVNNLQIKNVPFLKCQKMIYKAQSDQHRRLATLPLEQEQPEGSALLYPSFVIDMSASLMASSACVDSFSSGSSSSALITHAYGALERKESIPAFKPEIESEYFSVDVDSSLRATRPP